MCADYIEYHLGVRAPTDAPIRIVFNPDEINRRHDEFAAMFVGGQACVVQHGVFQYAWKKFGDAPASTYWLLIFFDVCPIIGAVRPHRLVGAPCRITNAEAGKETIELLRASRATLI